MDTEMTMGRYRCRAKEREEHFVLKHFGDPVSCTAHKTTLLTALSPGWEQW